MTLSKFGWNADMAARFERAGLGSTVPARVAREDKQSYLLVGEDGELRGELRGRLRHEAAGADLPAVGDWVGVQPLAGTPRAVIHGLVPRRSAFTRQAAGDAVREQVVAANIDEAWIVCGLDRDYNLRRLERYLALTFSSGAAARVVLSKADLCGETPQRVAEVNEVAHGAPLHVISAPAQMGMRELRAALREGVTAALLGSSGVGKSTLINGLLEEPRQRTAATRASDGRGRHTTTHRELLVAPGGGVLIDTPGMRELGLWADEASLQGAFSEIEALAAQCRFRDCLHQEEPRCAVLAAVRDGRLDAERLRSFHKLRREVQFNEVKRDRSAAAAEKARWKAIHRAQRKRYRER